MTFILLEEKYPYFRSLLCHMQLNDLILETDASYLHTPAEKFGSPMLLQDIATKITMQCFLV
jgi:Tat protein secretion system quality control protein TatD with DNase activity